MRSLSCTHLTCINSHTHYHQTNARLYSRRPSTLAECQADLIWVDSWTFICPEFENNMHDVTTCEGRNCPNGGDGGCCQATGRCFNFGDPMGIAGLETNCNAQYGANSFTTDYVCCSDGICRPNAIDCASAGEPASAPNISDEFLAYAQLLCLELNDCGGVGGACTGTDEAARTACRDLGCCDFVY